MTVNHCFLYNDLLFPTAETQDDRQAAAALGPVLTTCKFPANTSSPLG